MPGSVLWPGFVLLLLVVVLVLLGDVLRTVQVIVAGGFVVRVAVHVRRHPRQQSAGRTAPLSRSGLPVLRPLISADAGGSPTPLVSAGSSWAKDAA